MSFEVFYHSRLFLRLFATTAAVICLSFAGIYFLAVYLTPRPRSSAARPMPRAILDIAYEQLDLAYRSLARYRAAALAEKRLELRSSLKALVVRAEVLDQQAQNGKLSMRQAKQMLIEEIGRTRNGKDACICRRLRSNRALPPDPVWHGHNGTEARDPEGIPIAQRTLDLARAQGEGFFEYRWPRLGRKQTRGKIAYVMNIPAFRMAIVSALFLGDIDAQVEEHAKEEAWFPNCATP